MTDPRFTIGTITQLTGTGVEQSTDIIGDMRSRVVDVQAAQMEAGIRAKLIELGWTPPGAPVPSQGAEGVEALAAHGDGAWVPRDVLEAMAEIDVVDVDDPRGPGYTECPACGQSAQGHWEDPPHYVRPSVPHFAHCPAEFARRLRNSPQPHSPGDSLSLHERQKQWASGTILNPISRPTDY